MRSTDLGNDILSTKLNPSKNIEVRIPTEEESREFAKKSFEGGNFKHAFKYTGFKKSYKDADSYFNERLSHIRQDAEDFANLHFLIFYRGQIAGRIVVYIIDTKGGKYELGYYLLEGFLGKGIMYMTIKSIEGLLFNEFDANRIELCIDPENTSSLSLAKKLRYEYEGTLRQSYYNDFLGELRDDQIWSKLKSDFES